jgi:formate-dependent nitrite reductase membrane component NrfD
LLAARFGAAATAAASATLALLERRQGRLMSAERLEDLASLAAAAELALAHRSDSVYAARGVDTALRTAPIGPIYRLGAEIAGTLAPIGLYAANRLLTRRSGRLALPASLGVIIGSLALRMTILYAGNASARRPRDYFALTQAPGTVSPGRVFGDGR